MDSPLNILASGSRTMPYYRLWCDTAAGCTLLKCIPAEYRRGMPVMMPTRSAAPSFWYTSSSLARDWLKVAPDVDTRALMTTCSNNKQVLQWSAQAAVCTVRHAAAVSSIVHDWTACNFKVYRPPEHFACSARNSVQRNWQLHAGCVQSVPP